MLPESRQPIYMGINFIIVPKPRVNVQTNLRFQQSLIEQGIEFTNVKFQEDEIIIERHVSPPLVIRVVAKDPAIGQLVVMVPKAGSEPEMFIREAEAVVSAFHATWPTQRQIVSTDVTFRDLYETSAEHAFQELWGGLLGQPDEVLDILGWSILGGGLKFVVPPRLDDPEPVEIELNIESYLQDTRKIWVRTIFRWIQPMPPGAPLDPRSRLDQVDGYIEKSVIPFMMRRAK